MGLPLRIYVSSKCLEVFRLVVDQEAGLTCNIPLTRQCLDISSIALSNRDIGSGSWCLIVAIIVPGLLFINRIHIMFRQAWKLTIQFKAPSILLKSVPCSGWKFGAK